MSGAAHSPVHPDDYGAGGDPGIVGECGWGGAFFELDGDGWVEPEDFVEDGGCVGEGGWLD